MAAPGPVEITELDSATEWAKISGEDAIKDNILRGTSPMFRTDL